MSNSGQPYHVNAMQGIFANEDRQRVAAADARLLQAAALRAKHAQSRVVALELLALRRRRGWFGRFTREHPTAFVVIVMAAVLFFALWTWFLVSDDGLIFSWWIRDEIRGLRW